MKGSVRYIITRPCLSEGSVRLLKYLESIFPEDGPVALFDDRGGEHAGRVDRRAGRVFGLHDLYRHHNLGVNDVLRITPLGEGRYQVECVVKPVGERTGSAASRPRPPEPPQRVVVSESPYVREVRLERRAAPRPPAQSAPEPLPSAPGSQPQTPAKQAAPGEQPAGPDAAEAGAGPGRRDTRNEESAARPLAQPVQATVKRGGPDSAPGREEVRAGAGSAAVPALALPDPASLSPEELLSELAGRVGYRCERPTEGIVRLRAELGEQGYSVLVALDLAATARHEWAGEADYLAVLVGEHERPQGLPRLTREGLAALLENARLAPLTPIELRGYWNTGSFDLESAASVAELVSAQLSQRGVFSFVLLALAQQPAHSVVSAARLAERLGSGVNAAELQGVLTTLASAPFSALSPLGAGQYYLRADVRELLRGLGDYAEGLRVRLQAEARAGAR